MKKIISAIIDFFHVALDYTLLFIALIFNLALLTGWMEIIVFDITDSKVLYMGVLGTFLIACWSLITVWICFPNFKRSIKKYLGG